MRAMACVAPILRRMTDTAACIESLVALLNVISRCPAADIWNVLGLSGSIPLGRMVSAAEVDALLHSARRHAAMAYQSITGQPLEQARVADFMADIEAGVQEVGLKAFGTALGQFTGAAHSIAAELPEGRIGAYRFIVEEGMERLIPTCWLAGDPPIRLLGVERTAQNRVGRAEESALVIRSHRPSKPRVRHGLRYRDPRPRHDTRHRPPELKAGAMRAGEKLLRTKEK